MKLAMGNMLCCVQLDQSTLAIKERFGKFNDVLEPGATACHGALATTSLADSLFGSNSWTSAERPTPRLSVFGNRN